MKTVSHKSVAQHPRITKSYHNTAAGAEKKVHATLGYKKLGIFLFEYATIQKRLLYDGIFKQENHGVIFCHLCFKKVSLKFKVVLRMAGIM